MTLAARIRDRRQKAGLTLDQLAKKAGISKTYLWELESDEAGEKKPSADVLLKIAKALGTTLADLMGLPTVKADAGTIDLPESLLEFARRMEKIKQRLTKEELRELASMRFRGGQPRSADDWHALYLVFKRVAEGPQ